ncbi:probable G-protein coupled receptor Mth-like 10 isoform X2 [Anoplophora glabripennis]|uniref:probable G-protein coupled receptor Mth-like 10 isoform X2 n=1 Tax=Anoplophora glabripennis TaxID=217634 RepID=UPI0008742977|nr:probable G-protein coupled receptor Mth-like 10 isoform X2 [Anoplophora glabripennis]
MTRRHSSTTMSVILLLTLPLLFLSSSSASNESVNLCSSDTNVSYNSYTTARTENCGCENKVCLRKCCQNGFYHHHVEYYTITPESICRKHNSTSFAVPIYEGEKKKYDWNNSFVVGMLHCGNAKWQYFKMNNSNPKHKFYVQENGSLYFPQSIGKIFNKDRYCVDEEDGLTVYLCYPNKGQVTTLEGEINSIGMIISMPFLLATFLVYAILPESNLHRKALMNYVLTLFLAYIFLVIVQLYPGKFDENFVCPALGYLIIFFFLISFFWMNVMCLDMWFAFRGMRGFNGRRLAEKKRFLMYFAYAVGVPSLHILVVFLINKFGNNESDYFPGIGYEKCFLRDGLPNLLYFYGPMAILITVNVTLFILTAVKIQRVKKETSMLKQSDSKRHSYEDDKQNITEHVNKKTNTLYRFNLYVKLLFAMGINWTMEVISWAIEWRTKDIPSYIWYLTDFCNAMYGVFIFFIFVFKKKIWRSLKKRYYVFIGKPHFAHSVSVTQTTRSSNYSTTETGLNDHRLSELNNGRGEERMLHQN